MAQTFEGLRHPASGTPWTARIVVVLLICIGVGWLPTLAFDTAGSPPVTSPRQDNAPGTETAPGVGVAASPSAPAVNAQPRYPQAAPAVPSWPFFRLISYVIAGSLLSGLHLAHKFRPFLGLGVLANRYAVLLVLLGGCLSAIPVICELSSRLAATRFGLVIDPLGLVAILVMSRLVGSRALATTDPVAGLPALTDLSPNIVIAVIEDRIRDHILGGVQREVKRWALRYGWKQIVRAGQIAVDEEVEITARLGREWADAAMQSVSALRESGNPNLTDTDNKYRALVRLVRCCTFRRLGKILAASQAEDA